MEAVHIGRDSAAIRIADLGFLTVTVRNLMARGVEFLKHLDVFTLRELDLDLRLHRHEIERARRELRLCGSDFAIPLADGKQEKTPIPATLPTRVRRLLTRDLLATCLEEVAQYSAADLRLKGGFGERTISLLTDVLGQHGLEFREL